MRILILSAVAAAGLATAAASPAAAQWGAYVGPGGGGVYVDPGYRYGPPPPPPRYRDDWRYRDEGRVSRREAVRIARRNGVAEVYDVDRRGPYWIVRGESYRGRRIAVRVHRYDGRADW